MIKLENISKAYRVDQEWNVVLNDISVTFPTGESIGILGLNGAGKSTLLRIIGGIEPPDSGHVRKDIRVSWPIGFGGGLHGALTGRENARFIARIYGESPKKLERFAEEFTELGKYFDMPIKTYSSGMRARLSFATSMACEFDCYLVDEATAAGDRRFAARYREAFSMRLRGASMVMVSHNAQTVREYCSLGAVLFKGRLQIFQTVDKAMAAYNEVSV